MALIHSPPGISMPFYIGQLNSRDLWQPGAMRGGGSLGGASAPALDDNPPPP